MTASFVPYRKPSFKAILLRALYLSGMPNRETQPLGEFHSVPGRPLNAEVYPIVSIGFGYKF